MDLVIDCWEVCPPLPEELSLCTLVFWLVAIGGLWLFIALVMLGVADSSASSLLACRHWCMKMPYVLVSPLVGCSPWGRGVAYCGLFSPGLLVG